MAFNVELGLYRPAPVRSNRSGQDWTAPVLQGKCFQSSATLKTDFLHFLSLFTVSK